MKKIILTLATLAFCMGGIAAENFGIDIGLMFPMSFQTMSSSNSEYKEDDFALGAKLQTYDFFWADGHVGLYGMLGLGFNLAETNRSVTVSGTKTSLVDNDGNSFNFFCAIGPAFGTNLGSSNVRFNVGTGLHIHSKTYEQNMGTSTNKIIYDGSALWMGLNLNPQLRFTNNRRCSFLFGCELNFDGCVAGELGPRNGTKTDIKDLYDSTFAFTLVPYAGLGINF